MSATVHKILIHVKQI